VAPYLLAFLISIDNNLSNCGCIVNKTADDQIVKIIKILVHTTKYSLFDKKLKTREIDRSHKTESVRKK